MYLIKMVKVSEHMPKEPVLILEASEEYLTKLLDSMQAEGQDVWDYVISNELPPVLYTQKEVITK